MNALSCGAAGTRGVASRSKSAAQAVKSVALCAFVISMPQLALADTTTIDGPVTETLGPTNPPTPINLDGGDTLTIGPAGSVTVTGDNTYGINATGVSNTITNSGSISTSGTVGLGIVAGDGNTITNSG